MRKQSWLTASFLAALASLACAGPPERVEIQYEVMRNGKSVAEVVERLEQGDGTYQLTENWKGRGAYAVLGSAKRSSAGSLDANVPRPHEYVDERSGRDTQRVWFDWKANMITRRYKGGTRTEPVPADAQDRLSFLLALSVAAKTGQEIAFHVADGRGMSRHVYQPDGRERLATPAGEFDTLKLVRRNVGSGELAEIWFAADRTYFPVRILLQEKDGTRLEHVATRISP